MSANPNNKLRMNLQEARSVRYPFYEFPREPMGDLIDKGIIHLPELAYLIQKSKIPRILEASQVLFDNLTEEQNKKSASPSGIVEIHLLERRSFAEVRQIQLVLALGMILGILLTIATFLMVYSLINLDNSDNRGTSLEEIVTNPAKMLGTIIGLGILFFIMFIVNKSTTKIIDWFLVQIELYRKGQLGEKRVLNVISQVLDNNWHVFQNLELPGIKGDIDLVLVGPAGVLSFEVKAFSGKYRNVGDTWQKQWQKQWLPAVGNPGHQSRHNAKKLNRFFENNDIKQYVEAIIVWASPDAPLELENPTTKVWQLDQIATHLKELTPKSSFSNEQRDRIIGVLENHYTKTTSKPAD